MKSFFLKLYAASFYCLASVSCISSGGKQIAPEGPDGPGGDKPIESIQAVDLGLPSGTKWGSLNLGATEAEDTGDYFAWGEQTKKENYSWPNYQFVDASTGLMTKYILDPEYGEVDEKKQLEPADDIAKIQLGEGWSLPGEKEIEELCNPDFCNLEYTSIGGTCGIAITSRLNGNSIFIPAGGRYIGYDISNKGDYGYIWSRNGCNGTANALQFSLSEKSANLTTCSRSNGLNIRPVYFAEIHIRVTGISLNKDRLELEPGGTEQLIATVRPANAAEKRVTWSSNNTEVAIVDGKGNVTAIQTGEAIITATTYDGGFTATCAVTVKGKNSGDDFGGDPEEFNDIKKEW